MHLGWQGLDVVSGPLKVVPKGLVCTVDGLDILSGPRILVAVGVVGADEAVIS